jgi:hypothetical protein
MKSYNPQGGDRREEEEQVVGMISVCPPSRISPCTVIMGNILGRKIETNMEGIQRSVASMRSRCVLTEVNTTFNGD